MPAQNKPVGTGPDPVENASTRDTPVLDPVASAGPRPQAEAGAVLAPSSFAPELGKAIADAMIAANTARVTPASATPGMNEAPEGGMFIVAGAVVNARGEVIKNPPAEVKAHADETAGRRAVSQEMEPA